MYMKHLLCNSMNWKDLGNSLLKLDMIFIRQKKSFTVQLKHFFSNYTDRKQNRVYVRTCSFMFVHHYGIMMLS